MSEAIERSSPPWLGGRFCSRVTCRMTARSLAMTWMTARSLEQFANMDQKSAAARTKRGRRTSKHFLGGLAALTFRSYIPQCCQVSFLLYGADRWMDDTAACWPLLHPGFRVRPSSYLEAKMGKKAAEDSAKTRTTRVSSGCDGR